tara:strand:+ start:160 stop:411 length:252 start_codon:yes stop_codon:yes gene_type:complete
MLSFIIRAQNIDAMALLPERAEYEFYTYSVISGLLVSPSTKQKQLIGITDLVGRTVTNSKLLTNTPLFYIYDDGTVEKKIILE